MEKYIIAHRGASGVAPENTLKSYKIALEAGTDAIECDIRETADGKLVAMHDATVNRTTNGTGLVEKISSSYLQKLDAGEGEKIPELGEIFNLAKKYGKLLIIEIKATSLKNAEKTTKDIVKFLKGQNDSSFVSVCSFWHNAIKIFKKEMPNIPAVATMELGLPAKEILLMAEKIRADGISVEADFASKELVKLAHSKNMTVDTWTINTKELFEKVLEIGVNGIFTDFPHKFKL